MSVVACKREVHRLRLAQDATIALTWLPAQSRYVESFEPVGQPESEGRERLGRLNEARSLEMSAARDERAPVSIEMEGMLIEGKPRVSLWAETAAARARAMTAERMFVVVVVVEIRGPQGPWRSVVVS